MAATVIVPGLRNSGPTHGQTWFATQLTGSRRVEQDDWKTPHLSEWAARVCEQIDATDGAPWIVAHSFGCHASVTAGLLRPERIRGALLVAPPIRRVSANRAQRSRGNSPSPACRRQ